MIALGWLDSNMSYTLYKSKPNYAEWSWLDEQDLHMIMQCCVIYYRRRLKWGLRSTMYFDLDWNPLLCIHGANANLLIDNNWLTDFRIEAIMDKPLSWDFSGPTFYNKRFIFPLTNTYSTARRMEQNETAMKRQSSPGSSTFYNDLVSIALDSHFVSISFFRSNHITLKFLPDCHRFWTVAKIV